VVALLSGAVLAITGVISFGSRSGTTDNAATTTGTSTNTVPGDQQPIEMPATLAGFIDQGKAIQDVNAGAGQDRIAHLDQINQLTTTAMKESFGDVGVGVRSYATPGLESFGTGIAVRAPAPLLEVLPAQDADYLGLAAPPQEITVVGEVRCLVTNPVTAKGQQVDPAGIKPVQCQRTGPALTIIFYPSGDVTVQDAAAAAAAGALWDAASG